MCHAKTISDAQLEKSLMSHVGNKGPAQPADMQSDQDIHYILIESVDTAENMNY